MNNPIKAVLAQALPWQRMALIALPLGLSFGLATQAQAASLWNESTDGDLSDNGLTPTQLGPLSAGSNRLSATFNAGAVSPSPDYFTLEVPDGFALTGIDLRDWQSKPTFEDIAFFAVQKGDVFDFVVPEDRSNANGLLGWTHLRSTQVNRNRVLTELARSNQSPAEAGVDAFYNEEAETYSPEQLAAFPELPDNLRALSEQWVPGAEGFDQPLGAGEYTFWLRQGSDTNITADLDFTLKSVKDAVSTPEPMSLLALGMVTGAGLLLKRRR
ncbi:MAG: PEP-CTERM sorting domain-containing protein [Cyanobacteria bacterium P01_F01_bin.53]